MEYRYEPEGRSYEDFASGRVLYNARGTTSFPVRLASEIVQRCFGLLRSKGHPGPYSVYDPCCGGAYLLTVIGIRHARDISGIWGSDIDNEVLQTAERNLSLLFPDGLKRREAQIRELYAQYHKPSHGDALQSIGRLAGCLAGSRLEKAACFRADITSEQPEEMIGGKVDIIITDLPYGDIVSWSGGSPDPVRRFFDHVHHLLHTEHGVAAVIADKGQKLRHDKFGRLDYFKVGKRHAALFEPIR